MSLPQPISSSRPPLAGRSRRWWPEDVPILVAESLDVVDDPLLPLLQPAGSSPVAPVLGAMAGALKRTEDGRPVPEWLLEYQKPIVRRLPPMLARNGGALLAAPVGSGKTYMALATAALWSARPASVLVPAALIPQWRRTAERLKLAIDPWSHERLSRGTLPSWLEHRDRGLVIIDESHHFRNPASRRYRVLAPALLGRTVLLLTATPVVNRLADLASQLLLAIRDDALSAFGLASIREHLAAAGESHPALGALLLTTPELGLGKPGRRDRRSRPASPSLITESLCRSIDGLTLSRDVAIAGLIRMVLWRALASSPAALAGALKRYRGLLLHAWEAMGSGRTVDRAQLRRFLGNEPDQLLMWGLLPATHLASDLELADLGILDSLIDEVNATAQRADEKATRLAEILKDGARSVIFTSARETVRYLRDRLPGPLAWCTGDAAGIDHTRMPRDAVLSWFRPGHLNGGGPVTLVATDVAAEGLDLQRARRIVHYDLPWTSVRLDQRDGRALRLGSEHSTVDVIRFDPPDSIAERLGQVHRLARKRRLPRQAGLLGATARTWHWRDRLADHVELGCPGRWAAVRSEIGGLLAGFSILSSPERELASAVGWLDPDGAWWEQPGVIERIFAAALSGTAADVGIGRLRESLLRLSPVIKERLELVRRSRWSAPAMGSATMALIERLNRMTARAARDRDRARIDALERGLAFAARGHTAGEESWIAALVKLTDQQLGAQLARCPPPEARFIPRVRLNGLILLMPSS
jgi:superfamily II DNA or RNA helicase/predicted transcriptional regulator